ncbi:uncharacterized protein LOC128556152 [Mercenaria mercenaria]|uniref:uncharacterized protein LOC128556152 n=1 Tax=Mercenaria mercenaria TaxID=6596 RepID=UPI00234F767B|nr:uncharacterized protein LOC128556152 [Mercenaria mercenaria]
MATGGRLTRSRINASDELIDYVCSPCTKKNKTSEAVKYCVECQEYLCTSCVENHNSFSALSGHSLLGRSQLGTSVGTGARNLPSVPTDRCKVHATKLVEMYCANHDTVGCSVCFNISHKKCDDIHYIPEYVQKQNPTSQFSRLQSRLNATILKIESLAKQQQQRKVELKKNKDICLDEIQAFRMDINKTIDRLEQTTIKDLDDRFCALDQMFDNEMKAIQKTLDHLRKQIVSTETTDVNTSQQFVSLKLCQTEIIEAENLITGGSLSIDKNSLQFERNSKILDFLQSLYSLHKPQHHTTEQRVLPQKKKESLYQVKTKDSFNVKLPKDKEICDILTLCLLDCGDFLVADRENKILKQIDSINYKIKRSVKLPEVSNSVGTVNAEEAIVCLKGNSLQFVSTRGELVLTRRLKMDHCCLGVSVIACYIFVTDGQDRNIYKYDMNGTLLKKISGNKIFSWNRRIVGSEDKKAMYVTDMNKGLIKLDLEGNIIWNISGKGLKNAADLCTDELGNVFVADKYSNTVVQVTSDGECLGNVVTGKQCDKEPYGVCFNSKESKLFVSGRNCNDIHVYSLE